MSNKRIVLKGHDDDIPQPKFVVGELVYINGMQGLYRIQQVLYRSWLVVGSSRYQSGFGYKMPVQGVSGFYWMEKELSKPDALTPCKWVDCCWQPTKEGR